ncbi:TPA: lysozyme [Klebsiella pneumoniae]|jgi:lysozyme|nr:MULTISPECIES: lysozyme [Klebsiella]VED54123.1 muraminidase [Klebsiella aerogenes]AOE32471.1 muraminidase [Klebsiella pneumoniae]ARV39055.1 muraminidase [Klebsiella pneumoniae subsp. pneumoniae]EKS3262571.1 lysozyme [Klebsiella pneumoniae]KAB0318905.1 lysozyme [Klebsiella pneumoniae]
MQISNNGIALIKRFEGCRLTAYPDPGTGGGPWTIGYGWTGKVDGKPIKPGMKIDDATADRLLRTGVVSFDQAVSKMLKVSVTQNQYDALVSLAYNIGTRALSTSTLMKKLNAGDVKGAADAFLSWNRSGGKVMAGLTNRRKAEREVFLS